MTPSLVLNEIEALVKNWPPTGISTDIEGKDTQPFLLESSRCHLDISTTNESLTAEDGSKPNKLETMLDPLYQGIPAST